MRPPRAGVRKILEFAAVAALPGPSRSPRGGRSPIPPDVDFISVFGIRRAFSRRVPPGITIPISLRLRLLVWLSGFHCRVRRDARATGAAVARHRTGDLKLSLPDVAVVEQRLIDMRQWIGDYEKWKEWTRRGAASGSRAGFTRAIAAFGRSRRRGSAPNAPLACSRTTRSSPTRAACGAEWNEGELAAQVRQQNAAAQAAARSADHDDLVGAHSHRRAVA